MQSLFAVVGGYAVIAGLIVAKFAALQRFTPEAFVSRPWLIAIVATDGISAMAGGYAAAVLAPARPLLHAGVLVGIMLPLGILHARRNAGREPLWFQVAVQTALALGVPAGAWTLVMRDAI